MLTGASGAAGFEEASFHRFIYVTMPQIFACRRLRGAFAVAVGKTQTYASRNSGTRCVVAFQQGCTTLRVTEVLDRPRSLPS